MEKKKGRVTDMAMQWKHFALSNPFASNNHNNTPRKAGLLVEGRGGSVAITPSLYGWGCASEWVIPSQRRLVKLGASQESAGGSVSGPMMGDLRVAL